jgi:hypothetical protein
MIELYGFGNDPPEGNKEAIALLDALAEALDAHRRLQEKIESVP